MICQLFQPRSLAWCCSSPVGNETSQKYIHSCLPRQPPCHYNNYIAFTGKTSEDILGVTKRVLRRQYDNSYIAIFVLLVMTPIIPEFGVIKENTG